MQTIRHNKHRGKKKVSCIQSVRCQLHAQIIDEPNGTDRCMHVHVAPPKKFLELCTHGHSDTRGMHS